jgi:YVTN family beta-propeller protein
VRFSWSFGATVFLDGVALSPDGRRLYVARDENVSVIDTAINKTVGSLITLDDRTRHSLCLHPGLFAGRAGTCGSADRDPAGGSGSGRGA